MPFDWQDAFDLNHQLTDEERLLREALIQQFGYPSRPDEPARHLPSPETVALVEELLSQLDAVPVTPESRPTSAVPVPAPSRKVG